MGKLLRVIKNFSGGLSEIANDNMRDNQLVEARNTVPGENAGLARCKGTNIALPQVAAGKIIRRIIDFSRYVDNVATDMVLAFVDSDTAGEEEMYEYLASTGEWTKVANSDGSYGFLPVKSWFIHGSNLYWLDGTAIKVFNGTNISDAALSPSGSSATDNETKAWNKIKTASCVIQRGQRWFYGVGRNELIFSAIGDPLSVNTTNIINVNSKDNDIITALYTLDNNLLIFKKRSVWVLTGWDFANTGSGESVELSRLTVTSGTEFPETIATVENAVIYLGMNGVYRLRVLFYTSKIASENISNTKISKRIFKDGQLQDARAAVWNNIYYLSLDYTDEDGQIQNKEYRYYVSEKSFWGEFTQYVSCYAPALEGKNRLGIGTKNGYILYYDDESDHYIDTVTGGYANIPILIKTKGFDVVGNVFQDSKVKKLFISCKQYEKESTDLLIQIKADYADGAFSSKTESIEKTIGEALNSTGVSFDESLVWAEGSWMEERWGWSDTVSKQLPVGRKTKHLQFILKSEAAQPLIIYALGMLYKVKKVKGTSEGVRVVEIND